MHSTDVRGPFLNCYRRVSFTTLKFQAVVSMLKYCLYCFVIVPEAHGDPSRSQSQANTQQKAFFAINKTCNVDVSTLLSLSYFSNLFLVFQWAWIWTFEYAPGKSWRQQYRSSHCRIWVKKEIRKKVCKSFYCFWKLSVTCSRRNRTVSKML